MALAAPRPNDAPAAAGGMPLHRSARRLRWFLASFEAQLRSIERETGHRYGLDRAALSAAFVEWVRAFEHQKPADGDDRPRYVGFAAGLMLKVLIARAPLRLSVAGAGLASDDPARVWPEGYAYVSYCLNVRALVLEQDFNERGSVAPVLAEADAWRSFRENVMEDGSLAIAFLDLFAGREPEWTLPDLFRHGAGPILAARRDAALAG